MRKFALLLALALVLTCAGGALATSTSTLTVREIKEGRASGRLNPTTDPAIDAIRKVGDGDAINVGVATIGNTSDQLDKDDFQWIYEILTDTTDTTLPQTTFNSGIHTFILDLTDVGGGGTDAYQTEIPDGAFKNYKCMSKLVVAANKIKKVGAGAFENAEKIAAADGLNGILTGTNTELLSIGPDAFKNCKFATPAMDVVIGSQRLASIGAGAFAESNILTFATTSSGLTAIPADAFNGCDKLTTVTLTNSGVETIGERAFNECELLDTVIFSTATKTIGEKAFFECKALATITINTGSKLEKIGKSAFENCIAVTNLILTDATKLTTIEEAAFRGCVTLAIITGLAETKVDTIGENAFAYTTLGGAGKPIEFPRTLMTVGKGAFGYESSFNQAAGPMEIVFRKGTTSTADLPLNNAADLRAYLESPSLSMSGAFAYGQWPSLSYFDDSSVKIGNIGGTPESLFQILNKAPALGGIKDDPNDPDTKAIVGILKGMGFKGIHIFAMLTNAASDSLLSEDTISAISAIGPDVSRNDRTMLESRIKTAETNRDTAKVGTAVGDFRTEAEMNAAKTALQTAIDAAVTAKNSMPLPTTDADTEIRTLNKAIDAFNDAKIKTVTPPAPPTGGGSGSTGGSGGCAAGFAPIAALFVLGALKLRKGR